MRTIPHPMSGGTLAAAGNNPLNKRILSAPADSELCFLKYKIEFLPVELQGFKKKKITMGNDIETSEPLWFALFFHCLK